MMRTDEQIATALLCATVREESARAVSKAGMVARPRAAAERPQAPATPGGQGDHEGSVTGLPTFQSCPSFRSCSRNDCPLDPKAALHGGRRYSSPDEEACRARRSTRERIAVAHGFPAAWGLTLRERDKDARRAAWLALPVEVRERRLAPLREGRERRMEALRRAAQAVLTGSTERAAPEQGEPASCDAPAVEAAPEGSHEAASDIWRTSAEATPEGYAESTRPMTEDEWAACCAGYPASKYRRRGERLAEVVPLVPRGTAVHDQPEQPQEQERSAA